MDSFPKQPQDVLDYDVDMKGWFGATNDDIESVVVTIRSDSEPVPTLKAGGEFHPVYLLLGENPVRFKVWLSGGTDFVDYVVSCLVTTESDRKKEVEFKVKVRDR